MSLKILPADIFLVSDNKAILLLDQHLGLELII